MKALTPQTPLVVAPTLVVRQQGELVLLESCGTYIECPASVLAAPPGTRSRPFEIILESPQQAPQFLQELSFVASLRTILDEYRKFIAYGANL